MAPRTLPGLGLSGYWVLGEDGWNTLHDPDLRMLSALVQCRVLSRVTALPGSPTDGDIYIVPSGGDADKIAVRDLGAWVYFIPAEGYMAYVVDDAEYVIYDGAAWTTLNTGSAVTTIELSLWASGEFDASEVIFSHIAKTAYEIPINMVGSQFVAGVAATASTVFDVEKNGVGVGTLTWAIAGTVPTMVMASATAFATGDVLTLVAPLTPDATLADITGNIVGDL